MQKETNQGYRNKKEVSFLKKVAKCAIFLLNRVCRFWLIRNTPLPKDPLSDSRLRRWAGDTKNNKIAVNIIIVLETK